MHEEPREARQEAQDEAALIRIAARRVDVERVPAHRPHEPEERGEADEAGLREHPGVLRVHEAEARHPPAEDRPLHESREGGLEGEEARGGGRVEGDLANPHRVGALFLLEGIGHAVLHGFGGHEDQHGRGHEPQQDQPHDQPTPCAEARDHEEGGNQTQIRRAGEREEERHRHDPEQDQALRATARVLGLEGDAGRDGHHEEQVATEGVRLADLALERRGDALAGRHLREPDDAHDGRGDERRADEPPPVLAVAQVVHGHVVDDEVLDVLQDMEVARPGIDRPRQGPEQRRRQRGGHVQEDRPVQWRARDEVQLLVDGGLGQPREPDDEEHEVFGAEGDATPGADAGALVAELRRQQHREDDDVDPEIGADEGEREQEERSDGAHRVGERGVRQPLRDDEGAGDGHADEDDHAAGGRPNRRPAVL